MSTSRTARVVPEGIVTFLGGGGGGGVDGTDGAIAGAGVIAATGAGFESMEDGSLRSRICLRGFGEGDGLDSSTGAGASAGAGAGAAVCAASTGGGAATVRLLMTCFTPGSVEAYRAAASRSASLSTAPLRVTVPPSAFTPNCLP